MATYKAAGSGTFVRTGGQVVFLSAGFAVPGDVTGDQLAELIANGRVFDADDVAVDPTPTPDKGVDPSGTSGPLPITTQTASYTLALADADSLVRVDTAAASAVTVPPNSAAAIPVGRTVLVSQRGAGQVTLTPGAGVTLNSRGGALKTAGQFAQASLLKTGTDEWLVSGDLVV